MSPILTFATIAMLLAAVLYTVAVFGERAVGTLKPWHLVLFWLGLVFDTTGTTLMTNIAGGWRGDLHSYVGLTAVVLMLIHSVWATIALALKKEKILSGFHRFSIHVWALWMAAFVSGVVMVAFHLA
jgi:uncharacterized repeat protein (TIGR03987 family)